MKPFISKSGQPNNKTIGYSVRRLLGMPETAGDVGIEIEMEGGDEFPQSGLPKAWEYHKDHSLRGIDNAEYVLKRPIPFDDVSDQVNLLWKKLDDSNVEIDISNRTSLHVHLNCQTWNTANIAAFAAIFFCFEEILTEYCGSHRVGNLFCLRAKDAPAIVSTVKRVIDNELSWNVSDHFHYAGFNIQALWKFGSIEIRHMRGPTEPGMVNDWVSILRRLYEFASACKDPREICYQFSAQGPLAFFETIMGPYAQTLKMESGMDPDAIRNSLYEGIRMAQDICFVRDWDMWEPCAEDPFKRETKKIKASNVDPIADIIMGNSPTEPLHIPLIQSVTDISEIWNTPTSPQSFSAPLFTAEDSSYDENW